MARITVYATALAAAFAAFALAGGIQASQKAAVAVERQDHSAAWKYMWPSPISHIVHELRHYAKG